MVPFGILFSFRAFDQKQNLIWANWIFILGNIIVLIVVLILVCLFVNCRKRAILPELAGYKNIGYNNIEMSNVNNIVGYEEYQPQEQKMNVPYDEENLPKKHSSESNIL